MNIRTLRWANPEQTALIVNDEAIVRRAPDGSWDEDLRQRFLGAGGRIDIEPFRDHNDARRIRVLEVKAEARRRILALVPGCTLENRDEKQINALMQAVLGMHDVVLVLTTAVEALGADTAAARTILDRLAPMAAKGRKIVAIRAASDRFEDLIMNSPANPVTWDIGGQSMWPT